MPERPNPKQVRCPLCGAAPGESCRSREGRKPVLSHLARMKAHPAYDRKAGRWVSGA